MTPDEVRAVGPEEFELVALHSACDRGMAGFVYPDGGVVLDQPLALLEAFAVIGDAKVRQKDDDGN